MQRIILYNNHITLIVGSFFSRGGNQGNFRDRQNYNRQGQDWNRQRRDRNREENRNY